MKRIFIAAFIFAAALTAHSQPSANEIVFAGYSSSNGARGQIYSIRADGSGQVNLTNDPAGTYLSPKWSPDGTKIVYDYLGGYSIWVMNADGSNRVALTSVITGARYDPVWSPDGSKIAYWYDGYGFEPSSVVVFNVDGSGYPSQPIYDVDPGMDWSRDGKFVLLGVGSSTIWTANADGTNINQIFVGSGLSDPAWSPDGSKIAFSQSGEIFIMNADGSSSMQITSSPSSNKSPSWSPDGMRLAFSSNRDGPYNIYVMNADGTNVVRVTQNTFNSVSPAWKRVAAASSQYQLSGRVETPDGRGLRNVSVSITDSLGAKRTVTASSFGFYSFDKVPAGGTYTIAVTSKLYRFSPLTLVVNGNLTNVNFVGLE